MNIAIFASGKGTNFDAILKEIGKEHIKLVIYNNINAGVAEKAIKQKIRVAYLDHRHYETRELYDKKIIEFLKFYNIDFVVFAGWMIINTHLLVDEYKNRIINIHPSLLPAFKGKNAVKATLDSKTNITGCTVHFVSEEVDSGEIIAQRVVHIDPDDTEETLHGKIKEKEYILYPEIIKEFIIGKRKLGV